MKTKIQLCLLLVLALSLISSGFCAENDSARTKKNSNASGSSLSQSKNQTPNYRYFSYGLGSGSSFRKGEKIDAEATLPLRIPKKITYLSKQQFIYFPLILQVLTEKKKLMIPPSKLVRSNILSEMSSISVDDRKGLTYVMLSENLLNYYFKNKLGAGKDNEITDDHQISYLNNRQLKFFPLIMEVVNMKNKLMIKLNELASKHLNDNNNMSEEDKSSLKKMALTEALLNSYFQDPNSDKSTLETASDNDDSSVDSLEKDEDSLAKGNADATQSSDASGDSADNSQQTQDESSTETDNSTQEQASGTLKPVPKEKPAISTENVSRIQKKSKKRVIKRK